jgi:hypothetical protein
MRRVTNKDNPPATTEQSHEAHLSELSRRNFVEMLMLGDVGLVIPTQTAYSSQQTKVANQEIERVAGLVTKTRAKQPNLPGFKNLERWECSRFPKEFSQQDAEILQGALYLKAPGTGQSKVSA